MKAQKYLRIAIFGVIVVVILVAVYGIYINEASRNHIDKMEAARYTVLPVAYVGYRDIRAVVDDVDITARAPWTIDVTAQYEGVLSEVRAEKSERVKAGDVLATMTNNDLLAQIASAEADIEGARAQLLNAEQIVDRYKYLVEHNAIAVQEYDSAVAQRDATKAQLESRVAQRDLVRSEMSKMLITAPQAANIVNVYHEQGKYVRAGEPLFMVADLRRLSAFSVMTHKALGELLSVGNEFILEIKPYRLTHKAYPMDENLQVTGLALNQFEMSLMKAIPDVDTGADYHEVLWMVENPTGLLEPTYYDGAKIRSRSVVRTLVAPRRGVHSDGGSGRFFVYTLDDDFRLKRQFVTCGIRDDTLVEITSGLSEGSPVVIAEPADYAEGMKVGAKEYEF